MPVRPLPSSSLEALVREHILLEEDPGTATLIRSLAAARSRGYLTKGELEAVCRWKSARAMPLVRSNHSRQIRRATAAALRSRSERQRLDALLTLRGVSIPMASAALTLLYPRRYGVLDIRVWQLLHTVGAVEVNRGGTGFTFEHWSRFLALIRQLAAEHGVTARTVERTLFALHEKYQEGLLYRVPVEENRHAPQG